MIQCVCNQKSNEKENKKMMVCTAEAMKMIKILENEKNLLINKEDESSSISYKEGEEKIAGDYDYEKTRSRINEIDSKIRKIRYALAKSNCSTMLDGGFDCSVAEGLVLLAQLREELGQVKSLLDSKQLERRITNTGVIEYTECLYSVAKAEKDYANISEKIFKLQVAIDRANLNNGIEL